MLWKWFKIQRDMREQAARDAMRIMFRNSLGQGPVLMLHEVRGSK